MTAALRPVTLAVVLGLLVLLGCACRGGPGSEAPVPDPDLTDMEPQVADLLRRTRQSVVADPDSPDAWGGLGAAYDAHGLMSVAEPCYRRAHELAPEDFNWAYLLAVVREIQGADHAEVVALFETAKRIKPDYAPIYVRLGDALSLRGEHEAARDAFLQALRLEPQTAVAHRGLGQVMLALGDAQSAVEQLTRAIELEPRDLSAYSGLAQALMRLNRAEQARQVIERSRGLEPVNAFADPVYGLNVFTRSVSSSRAYARALGRIRDGAYAEAAEDLRLVLQARPDDASVHYWLGTAYRRLGQWEAAVEHLSRSVEVEPALVDGWLQLAEVFASQGQITESKGHYARAAALRPVDAGQHYALGRALLQGGDAGAAAEHFRESLRLGPGHADAHAGLGQALERLDRVEDALREYAAAVRLDPEHPARQRLATLRSR